MHASINWFKPIHVCHEEKTVNGKSSMLRQFSTFSQKRARPPAYCRLIWRFKLFHICAVWSVKPSLNHITFLLIRRFVYLCGSPSSVGETFQLKRTARRAEINRPFDWCGTIRETRGERERRGLDPSRFSDAEPREVLQNDLFAENTSTDALMRLIKKTDLQLNGVFNAPQSQSRSDASPHYCKIEPQSGLSV